MKMLKELIIRVVSVFATGEFAISFDEDRRWATAFSRGRRIRVPMIAGAAFEVLETNIALQVLATGVTYTQEIGAVPSQESQPNFQVTKVSLTPQTVLTGVGAAGAGATFVVRKGSVPAGGGATAFVTVASLQFNATVNGVAEQERDIPLSAVAGATTVNAGDILEAQWIQGATGLALPASVVKVELG